MRHDDEVVRADCRTRRARPLRHDADDRVLVQAEPDHLADRIFDWEQRGLRRLADDRRRSAALDLAGVEEPADSTTSELTNGQRSVVPNTISGLVRWLR